MNEKQHAIQPGADSLVPRVGDIVVRKSGTGQNTRFDENGKRMFATLSGNHYLIVPHPGGGRYDLRLAEPDGSLAWLYDWREATRGSDTKQFGGIVTLSTTFLAEELRNDVCPDAWTTVFRPKYRLGTVLEAEVVGQIPCRLGVVSGYAREEGKWGYQLDSKGSVTYSAGHIEAWYVRAVGGVSLVASGGGGESTVSSGSWRLTRDERDAARAGHLAEKLRRLQCEERLDRRDADLRELRDSSAQQLAEAKTALATERKRAYDLDKRGLRAVGHGLKLTHLAESLRPLAAAHLREHFPEGCVVRLESGFQRRFVSLASASRPIAAGTYTVRYHPGARDTHLLDSDGTLGLVPDAPTREVVGYISGKPAPDRYLLSGFDLVRCFRRIDDITHAVHDRLGRVIELGDRVAISCSVDPESKLVDWARPLRNHPVVTSIDRDTRKVVLGPVGSDATTPALTKYFLADASDLCVMQVDVGLGQFTAPGIPFASCGNPLRVGDRVRPALVGYCEYPPAALRWHERGNVGLVEVIHSDGSINVRELGTDKNIPVDGAANLRALPPLPPAPKETEIDGGTSSGATTAADAAGKPPFAKGTHSVAWACGAATKVNSETAEPLNPGDLVEFADPPLGVVDGRQYDRVRAFFEANSGKRDQVIWVRRLLGNPGWVDISARPRTSGNYSVASTIHGVPVQLLRRAK